MPGRPRTMLRRVERLEVAAYELANAMSQTIPDQYRTRPDGGDYTAETWKDALDAAIHAWTMIAELGDALREKARIPGDGPTAECRLRRRGESTDVDPAARFLADDPEQADGGAVSGDSGSHAAPEGGPDITQS